ncbi:MAG: rRNA pseudouridine synthase [Bacilli bacterium]|jgi:23S rRNA pseudouridine2605 synthase|nr:rRNA pseudouridine synthase [Bacilli bacterium]MCX4253794.1 pseudouridine synthase [Bacilli bacterium]
MERLQKVIANSGVTSRRKAEEMISKGNVRVNGKVVTELGVKVSGNDIIEVDGVTINRDTKKVYYILNKPREVITSVSDDKNRKTVLDCINTDIRVYPVGRLDYDTTGLIILTNDGELANKLMHPSNKIEKTYIAKIEGLLNKDDIDRLKRGINIDDRKVEIVNFKIRDKDLVKNTSLIEITIIEGRNHIVKRIFESLKHPVIRLSRIRLAFLDIKNLKSGEYRELSLKEVKKLYSL